VITLEGRTPRNLIIVRFVYTVLTMASG
jgi:hypothetical protein